MQIHAGFSEIHLIQREMLFCACFSFAYLIAYAKKMKCFTMKVIWNTFYNLSLILNFPTVHLQHFQFFKINAKNILVSRKRKQLSRKRKQLKVVNSTIVYIFEFFN